MCECVCVCVCVWVYVCVCVSLPMISLPSLDLKMGGMVWEELTDSEKKRLQVTGTW